MNPILNVRFFCSPVAHARHVAVLASLPATYSVNPERPVDIAVSDETPASIAAAYDSMPGVLVVERPGRLSQAEVQALAGGGLPVFPLLQLASALSQVGPASLPQAPVLVRSHLSWEGDPMDAAIEHLVALEGALGTLSDPQFLETERGYAGRARTGAVEVAWSGRSGADASQYQLDIVGLNDRLEVYADLAKTSKPLLVRTGSAKGFQQPQGVYESHLRLFWRNLALDRTSEHSGTQMSRLLDAMALLGAVPSLSGSAQR